MSNQITGYARKILPKLLIVVLLAAPATLIAPQPALAAPTFTVNSGGTSDVIAGGDLTNGVCQTASNNTVCTLRAAIMKANHFPGGGVTINIPSGTYTVTIPAFNTDDETTGNLDITARMSIIGAGAASTIIDGNGSAINDNVMYVHPGVTVTVANVTLRNGLRIIGNYGGGIWNDGNLTLVNTTVSGNEAVVGGGGILDNGTLNVINSTVSGNNASGGGVYDGRGGGILTSIGTITLTNSTVSGNSAKDGGGIELLGGTLMLVNSTISGNNARQDGGGIWNHGTVTAINSTISGNNSAVDGGGILQGSPGTSYLFNTTVAFNQADSDLNGSGTGGGVQNSGTFNFTNSIIAMNYATFFDGLDYRPLFQDCSGSLASQGHNIAYTDTVCAINGPITLTDPLLGTLQNNGGATQTHALLAGSPAIDAGDNTLGGCKDNVGATLPTDQRGAMRPVDGGIALRCDIGAYEVQRLLHLPLITR